MHYQEYTHAYIQCIHAQKAHRDTCVHMINRSVACEPQLRGYLDEEALCAGDERGGWEGEGGEAMEDEDEWGFGIADDI